MIITHQTLQRAVLYSEWDIIQCEDADHTVRDGKPSRYREQTANITLLLSFNLLLLFIGYIVQTEKHLRYVISSIE